MSSRARRLSVSTATATPVTSWVETLTDVSGVSTGRRGASIVPGGGTAVALNASVASVASGASVAAPSAPSAAVLEKEIFAKGFAQGERAGTAAAQAQSAALAAQLTQTLEGLMQVREQMIHQTERQMVQLALAIARRVVHREISLDQDLLLAMMRVALERLTGSAKVTVRLNPAEYEAVTVAMGTSRGDQVNIMADPRVGRGGCRVESEYGEIEAGVDAQIQEIARALLGDEALPA
jgi:flagellar assembly protein FliH